MHPTFSFVIPVFNAEKYLVRCLESIFAQTCSDFEVIVVDDASTGNCREIVESFGQEIHYVRHDRNKSLLQARITGARHAKGEYLIPVDADDYVRPCLVEELKKALADGNWTVIVYQMEIERDNTIVPAWHNHVGATMSMETFWEELRSSKTFWTMCGKAYRRDSYLAGIKWAGIAESFYLNNTEDLCQMVPLIMCGGSVKFIEYRGYRYWTNPASMTKSIASVDALRRCAKQCQSCIDLLESACLRHGCHEAEIKEVKALIEPTVKWFIEELRELPPQAWSECVNMLCSVHNTELVLRLANRGCSDILKRYRPSRSVFSGQVNVPIRTIGIVCCRSSGGGAERATMLWAEKALALGYRLIWFCDESYVAQMAGLDRRIRILPLPVDDLSQRWAILKKQATESSVDLFLLVDHWRNLIFRDLMLVKSLGRKAIVAEHSAYLFPWDDLNFNLYDERARFYPIADAVTVLSPENVAWWCAAGLKTAVYMPNFLTFDREAESAHRAFQRKPTGIFLCVGRICTRKNQNLIIDAFAQYRREETSPKLSRLLLLGRFNDEKIASKIREQIDRYGLASSVDILGEVSDVSSYYRKADVLLVASRLEGAPMVINEAKANGLPTVMFDLPYVEGTRYEDGVVSVPMGDVSAMAREMHRLVSSVEYYDEISRAAAESLRRYSARNIMNRWRALLKEIGEGAKEINPMCEPVSADKMLPMTMNALASLVPVLQGWWEENLNAVWVSSQGERSAREDLAKAWKAHDTAAADRDKAYRDLAAAWRTHDEVSADRDMAYREWHFWESEFLRLDHSRSFIVGRFVTWPGRILKKWWLRLFRAV